MTDNICERIRKIAVKSVFNLKAFENCWDAWKYNIHKESNNNFNASNVLNLGDKLAQTFRTTSVPGRRQTDLSGGGYGWEGLVCWYLNLCMVGSRAVAIRGVTLLPEPLRDSISVNYGNFRSNTESDIIVLIFPEREEFTNSLAEIEVFDNKGKSIAAIKENGDINYNQLLDHLSDRYFENFELGIIQCKTNWNDNAQIPMLWSMIYEAKGFRDTSISIGRNGYSMNHLDKFTYSFCTVPTNSLENYSQTSTAVNRVRNLSGGNYWGYPSKDGIASSLKEIFNHNFGSAFLSKSQRSTLRDELNHLAEDYSYFRLTN